MCTLPLESEGYSHFSSSQNTCIPNLQYPLHALALHYSFEKRLCGIYSTHRAIKELNLKTVKDMSTCVLASLQLIFG